MSSLSVSKAWDESREIIRKDGRLLGILALAFIGLPSMISAAILPEQGSGFEPQTAGQTFALLFAGIIALLGQLSIARMALPPQTTVGEAIRHGLRRLLPQILAAIIAFAALLALCIPVLVAAAAMGVSESAAATGTLPGVVVVLVLVTIASAIYVAVRLMMMTPVAAAENVGSIGIISRSWQLTRGHFWRLFGFLLMVIAALAVVSIVIALVVGSLVIMAFGNVEPFSMAALIIGLVQGVMSAAFTILFVVMAMRIYVQLSGRSAISADPAGS